MCFLFRQLIDLSLLLPLLTEHLSHCSWWYALVPFFLLTAPPAFSINRLFSLFTSNSITIWTSVLPHLFSSSLFLALPLLFSLHSSFRLTILLHLVASLLQMSLSLDSISPFPLLPFLHLYLIMSYPTPLTIYHRIPLSFLLLFSSHYSIFLAFSATLSLTTLSSHIFPFSFSFCRRFETQWQPDFNLVL